MSCISHFEKEMHPFIWNANEILKSIVTIHLINLH